MRRWLLVSAVVLPLGLLVAWGRVPGEDKPGAAPKAAPTAKPARAAKAVDLPAAVQPMPAKSRVVKVTVYPNSALVTREVEVPPGNGLVELVVTGLPERVQNSSLYSEGNDGIRVLSTRYRTQPVFEDTREDVRRLQEEQKTLALAAQKIQSEIQTITQNMQMLTKLENFTDKSAVHSTEKGGLNGDTVITLAKYVMEQRVEKAKELVLLQQQQQANMEQAQFVQRKMRDKTAGSTRVERDAILLVDRENGGGGKVRLNYLTDAASWRTQYKLRAGKAKEPVRVEYQAAVVQQTGEEWSHVDLTLSTAQPMLNASPPDLKKLEVTVVARASLPAPNQPVPNPPGQGQGGFRSQPAFDSPFGTTSLGTGVELEKKALMLRQEAITNYNTTKDVGKAAAQINEAAAIEQTRDLMKSREDLVVEQRNQKRSATGAEGPSVSYHLDHRLTVPSRTDEQVIEIAKLSLDPKYYYKAVPVLGQHVYRLADLVNKSSHVLLPGEATMYQDTDFVGRMTMPLVAIGEEFTAGFGVDPQVQIQRQMVDKARTTQGGNQVLTYKYRILVSSYKPESVKLQVWDRLPHAETETAGITLVKASPDVSKDTLYERENRPHNLLRWDLDVEPNMNGERATPINYEFRLELDRNMAISGLLTR